MLVNGTPWAVLFSCLLITASVWDMKKRIIPDSICVVIAILGILTFHPSKSLGILVGLPFLVAALFKEGGMGGGDIKLVTACSFALGFPLGSLGTILGLVAVVSWLCLQNVICKMKKKPSLKQQTVPLAPFLSIGYIAIIILHYIGGNLI